ncbi:MAG TPA: toluene hydroxylase [Polyangia bacterium]|nr:toluene hydroxylase [Polyangia bacterium]
MKPPRKTYWHLGAGRRLPSDYEIATSRLLYHVERGGFALALPTSEFHARHQRGSRLVSDRWDELADPRATTYTKYVDLAREREAYLERLLEAIEASGHDRELADEWVETLARTLAPFRFLGHGLQMVAAYVGQMAPAGRIAVAALFQCGDEIRRIQRVACRLALLRRRRPEIAAEGRALWQSDPRWQPLRRALEKLLVTYDWGEAFVALNVCLKPVIDDLFLIQLAERADRARAHLDAQILRALHEDCRWHRAWTEALLALAGESRPENRAVVAGWVAAWTPAVEAATRAASTLLGGERRPTAGPATPAKGVPLG